MGKLALFDFSIKFTNELNVIINEGGLGTTVP